MDGTNYHPFIYTHPNGEETKYDLQQMQYEDRPPMYVVSESPDNQGPGFDNQQTRDEVIHRAAQSALALNDPELFVELEEKMRPEDLRIFQQRPDGDFDRVGFRQIGGDGRSNVDIEVEQNAPELYPQFRDDQQYESPQITEISRTPYTREELLDVSDNAPLRAPEQTLQQQQESLQEQWKDLSGPKIDNAAEQAADQQAQQRSQEQAMQMNQHQEQSYQSQEH